MRRNRLEVKPQRKPKLFDLLLDSLSSDIFLGPQAKVVSVYINSIIHDDGGHRPFITTTEEKSTNWDQIPVIFRHVTGSFRGLGFILIVHFSTILATDSIGQLGLPVRAVQSGKARQLMAQRHLYIHIYSLCSG